MAIGSCRKDALSCEEGAFGSSISNSVASTSAASFARPALQWNGIQTNIALRKIQSNTTQLLNTTQLAQSSHFQSKTGCLKCDSNIQIPSTCATKGGCLLCTR